MVMAFLTLCMATVNSHLENMSEHHSCNHFGQHKLRHLIAIDIHWQIVVSGHYINARLQSFIFFVTCEAFIT